MTDAPTGSNSDEWALFLSEWGTAYCAVRIAEAIAAAEKRGYARGIEAATSICASAFAEHMTALILGDEDNSRNRESAANMAEKLLHAIRALSPTPPDPVAEAATVLLDRWLSGAFEDGADAAADDAITDQWAHVDRTYPDASPIIEAWLRALAEQEKTDDQ
jgi:hypothetical protein